jgi:nucleoside-diphosphate kinase
MSDAKAGAAGPRRERTLVLIKPDGVERAIIGKIITKFEDAGLKVVGMKLLKADEETVGKHYVYDEKWLFSVGEKTKKSMREKGVEMKETELEIGKRVRNFLMKDLTRSPIVALVLEGYYTTEVARKIAGATQPKTAEPSSIRGMYASDNYELADALKRPVRNVVHVSESKEIAEKEITLWFKDSELLDYRRADEGALFGA